VISRLDYSRPPDSQVGLDPRRVALLLLVAAASAILAFAAGRSLGAPDDATSPLSGTGATAKRTAALPQRLRPVPGIPALRLPQPEPATTTSTTPTTPAFTAPTPAPSVPQPSPSPSPAPAPTPAPAAPSGGGSFDDSG
jgi:outer membrane biosynthesis protein TonB